jgi:ElaB/YqjD/DUF883 family membrane-anchored ribosome-binding protein
MENEEMIREKMEHTREALTDKLEILEDQIVGSVRDAATAVRDSVTAVKETFGESVETVKDAFDIPAQVDRHPWLAIGASVACGYALGMLLTGKNGKSERTYRSEPERIGMEPAPSSPPPTKPGLLAAFEPELNHLKALAIGAALGTLREMLSEKVPPHMAEELRGIIDNVTQKLGGETLTRSDLEGLGCAPNGPCGNAAQS